jgi:hypothetical protein
VRAHSRAAGGQRPHAGGLEKEISKETTLGRSRPQGGTASPILFNIYMHELDKHVTEKYTQYCEQENLQRQNYSRDPTSRRYRQLERSARTTKRRIDTTFRRAGATSVSSLKDFPEEFQQYKDIRKTIRRTQLKKYKFPSQASHLKKAQFLFIRYADDWAEPFSLTFPKKRH